MSAKCTECGKPAHGNGLCKHHYLKAWKAKRKAREESGDFKKCSKCDKPVAALGLCDAHYKVEWRARNGFIPSTTEGMSLSDKVSFYSGEITASGCIEWVGGRNKQGYGKVRVGDKTLSAHRVAYSIAHGDIPAGHVVMHSCDNPSCVNPDHLTVGTYADNVEDMFAKGRNREPIQGSLHPSAKLTEGDIASILTDPRPYSEIAKDYGVSKSCIGLVRVGKTWTHVGSPQNKEK